MIEFNSSFYGGNNQREWVSKKPRKLGAKWDQNDGELTGTIFKELRKEKRKEKIE